MGTRTLDEKVSQRDITRLDYEQAHETIRMLSDVRFKLLTLVPFVSGATITFLSLDPADAPPHVVLAGSCAGFLVTVGILFYDYRNTQIIEVTRARCLALERFLGLPIDGQFKTVKRFSPLRAEWGLAVIYSTVLAAWSYLIVYTLQNVQEPSGTHTLLAPLVRWATLLGAVRVSGAVFFLLLVLIFILITRSRTLAEQAVEEGEIKQLSEEMKG